VCCLPPELFQTHALSRSAILRRADEAAEDDDHHKRALSCLPLLSGRRTFLFLEPDLIAIFARALGDLSEKPVVFRQQTIAAASKA
jgi:hypothetical protein